MIRIYSAHSVPTYNIGTCTAVQLTGNHGSLHLFLWSVHFPLLDFSKFFHSSVRFFQRLLHIVPLLWVII